MNWHALHGLKDRKTSFYINVLLGAVLVAVSTLLLLRLVADPDFFWHLKTGEWIWQNKQLPSEDVFSYTSPPEESMRARFILTSYWLSQVSYHLFHDSAGMEGIVVLRFLVYGALLYCLLKLRGRSDLTLYLGLLLLFSAAYLMTFPPDRPQVYSFLLFAVLLLLLDRIKQGEAAGSYGVPVLMLIWGNVHGGYVMGQAILTTYCLTEGIKFLRPGLLDPIGRDAYRRLLLTAIAGIACSLINPNTYHALTEMREVPSYMMAFSNIEYRSTLENFLRNTSYSIPVYWFMLLLAAFSVLISIKRIDLTDLVLLAATGYFSFIQIRYVAFFLIAAVPITGKLLSREAVLSWTRPFIVSAAVLIVMFFSRGELHNIGNIGEGRWVNDFSFPVRAADFIVANDLKGNMFNFYGWGGYLIWRLGPERKVFTDGRALYGSSFAQAQLVYRADTRLLAGMPFWESLLASFNVQYIVTPIYFPESGMMMPLVRALDRSKDWVPVFIHHNSLIFVRNTPANRQIIDRAGQRVKKEYLGESMLFMISLVMNANPGQARFHIAKGDVYAHLSRFEEAQAEYERALAIAPFNKTVKEGMIALKEQRGW